MYSGKGERLGYRGSGFHPGWQRSYFSLIETLSITGQKFSKCPKNGSERLRKGNLRWWSELRDNVRSSGKVSRVSGVSFHVSLVRDFLLAGCFRKALWLVYWLVTNMLTHLFVPQLFDLEERRKQGMHRLAVLIQKIFRGWRQQKQVCWLNLMEKYGDAPVSY